jgi:hypothetical protein
MTRIGVAAICSVLMTAESLTGQNPATPLLTLNDIAVAINDEMDARHVFVTVLTHGMGNHERREFFLASQVRSEWLPVIPGVEFVRLTDTEIAGHLSACGHYWLVSKVERVDNVVSMKLNQRCGGTMLDYIVSLEGQQWRLGPPGTGKDGGGWGPGIGSGFVGRPPGCPCLNP